MAREHNSLTDPRCLRRASGKSLVPSGLQGVLQYLCKQRACIEIQYWRGFTGTFGGAYGAVGFSGVKDARKSVLIADALSVGCLTTSGLQNVNKKETTGLQKVDSRKTPELQHDYISTTEMLQRSPNSGDLALWKQAEGAA